MIARLRYKITQLTTEDVKTFWTELVCLLAIIVLVFLILSL